MRRALSTEYRDVFVFANEVQHRQESFTSEQIWGALRSWIHTSAPRDTQGVLALACADDLELTHIAEYLAAHPPARADLTRWNMRHVVWRLLRSRALDSIEVGRLELELQSAADLEQWNLLIAHGGAPRIQNVTLCLGLDLGPDTWRSLDLAAAFPDATHLSIQPHAPKQPLDTVCFSAAWLTALTTWKLPRSLSHWSIRRASLTWRDPLAPVRDLARTLPQGADRRLDIELPYALQDSDSHWEWLRSRGFDDHLTPGVRVHIHWY